MPSLSPAHLSLAAALFSATLSASALAGVDFSTCAKPVYPRESLRHEQTGTVTLAFQIGADGKVTASRIDNSSGFPLLDIAARESLEKCTFSKPEGAPDAWIKMQYKWSLGSSKEDGGKALQADISGTASGDAAAMFRLAIRHLMGRGVGKDLAEAKRLLEQSATLGHMPAAEALGGAHFSGAFGTRNLDQAELWLRKAADAGGASAQARLGTLLLKTSSAAGAQDEGLAWLRKAAQQGSALGQTHLALALAERGAAADKTEVLDLLGKAAAQNDREAQFQLGLRYQAGDGVEKDLVKAASLFAKPAAAGHPRARAALEQSQAAAEAAK